MNAAAAAGLTARVLVHRGPFTLDASFDAAPGRVTALLGPNGSGKTTLLAAIAGLQPVDEGRITLDGDVLDDSATGAFVAPERRRVGVVFQDSCLFAHMSVLDNVAFGPRSRGRGTTHRRAVRTRVAAPTGGRRPRGPAAPRSSPAGRRSESPWPEPLRPSPTCSCSTSRWPPSTLPPGSRSGASSARIWPDSLGSCSS